MVQWGFKAWNHGDLYHGFFNCVLLVDYSSIAVFCTSVIKNLSLQTSIVQFGAHLLHLSLAAYQLSPSHKLSGLKSYLHVYGVRPLSVNPATYFRISLEWGNPSSSTCQDLHLAITLYWETCLNKLNLLLSCMDVHSKVTSRALPEYTFPLIGKVNCSICVVCKTVGRFVRSSLYRFICSRDKMSTRKYKFTGI